MGVTSAKLTGYRRLFWMTCYILLNRSKTKTHTGRHFTDTNEVVDNNFAAPLGLLLKGA